MRNLRIRTWNEPLLLVASFTCVFAQWLPQVPVDTRSLDQIYAVAKSETGNLQVFFGGDAGSQGDGVRSAWEARFPDIKLNLTVDLSKYHDNRIDRAFYEQKHVVDVAVLQTLQDFPRWKQENRLLFYKSNTFMDLLGGEKDLDGAFLPVQIISFGTFYYDSSKLPNSSVPTSFASLIDPTWRGKLILTYPNDDDAVAYLFSLIVSRYGADWLYALANNDVQWVRGTGTPGFELIRQHNISSRCLTFIHYVGAGAPSYLVSVQPKSPEQYMSWAQTGAIIAGTPRPESSRLFLAWLTSSEWQTTASATGPSVLFSVNQVKGVDPYASNVTQTNGFRLFEGDRARVEWWKNLYEDVLGTPQGPSPLAIYPNPK